MRFAAKIMTAAMVLTIGTLLLGRSAAAEPELQRAVRIAGATYLGDLPTYVADDRGFFVANGLDVRVEYAESGKQNMARLRAGETDFALMALTPVVLDRLADPDPNQPDDPVILANMLNSIELTHIVASSASGIKRPADFHGRRVAFERGTNTEFVWWLFEQLHDIEGSSIETLSIPFEEIAEALLSGRVDAAVLPEPWASRVEAQARTAGAPLRHFATQNLYSAKWVIVTTRNRLRAHGTVCRDVLAAYQQAIEFIERKPAEASAIYARGSASADHILTGRWDSLDYEISIDWALISALREQFNWARAAGYDNVGGPVRVLELLETGPLQECWPGSVHIPAATSVDETP